MDLETLFENILITLVILLGLALLIGEWSLLVEAYKKRNENSRQS